MLCACLLTVWRHEPALASPDAELSPGQLMQILADVPRAAGRFTERKYFSVLDEPLILEGTLKFVAPDYLKKEFDDPDTESYEVRGDRLTVEYPDGRRRNLSLDEDPALRAFVECYRGTLAGDLESLQRHFMLELHGEVAEWSLRLQPREPALAQYLNAVVIHGRGPRVHAIDTLAADGDRSSMIIFPASE